MTRIPTIADCAREPIHLSGAIQPHGVLVSCSPQDWIIRRVSANVTGLFDVESAEHVLGRTLDEFIAGDALHELEEAFAAAGGEPPLQPTVVRNVGSSAELCALTAHAGQDLLHVEIERMRTRRAVDAVALAQPLIAAMATAGDLDDFLQRVVEQVRELTGFGRVMLYRFRHDGAGEVVAEARSEAMASYLGLRYPAADIPPQARALYLRNRLRLIADVRYAPVPILPVEAEPLDLSFHVLRSVSPVHLEYLRNMGVAASMSISLICGGALWGLIACHHDEPRWIPPNVRAAADFVGLFASMRIAAAGQEQMLARIEQAERAREVLVSRMRTAASPAEALAAELDALCRVFAGDGAACWVAGEWRSAGTVPQAARRDDVLAWLHAGAGPDVVSTEESCAWSTAAPRDATAGVLAIRLNASDWLLVFRDEQIETVRWAGEPHKAIAMRDDGVGLGPRRSFAEWRETVRGRSLPWTERDLRSAEQFTRLLDDLRPR
ncbi:MAG TPA: GAF domain-containing protein [Lysobacter sp.]|nr:GAF domain-containing protein [Lysobacter sp.]